MMGSERAGNRSEKGEHRNTPRVVPVVTIYTPHARLGAKMPYSLIYTLGLTQQSWEKIRNQLCREAEPSVVGGQDSWLLSGWLRVPESGACEMCLCVAFKFDWSLLFFRC